MHSLVDGNLGCVSFGAIMINASKTFMYLSLFGHVFSIPSSIQFEIAVSYGKPAFSPLNSVLDISTPALPFYIHFIFPHQHYQFLDVVINPGYPPLVEVVVILEAG